MTQTLDFTAWKLRIRESEASLLAESDTIEERRTQIDEELSRIGVEKRLIMEAERLYETRMSSPEPIVQGDSLKEVLILNFCDDDGVLIGKNASIELTKKEYFPNRERADSSVYAILGKPPFERVNVGIYRVSPKSQEWIRLRGSNGHQTSLSLEAPTLKTVEKQEKISDKVKSLLEDNPNWANTEVLAELESINWDFKGKTPIQSVNMAMNREHRGTS